MHFSIWIGSMWIEWANELGFKNQRDVLQNGGWPLRRDMYKHFDAWLREKVGVDV